MLTSTSSDGRAVVKVTAKQPKSKKQTNLFILQKKKRKINQGLSFVQFRRGFRLPQRSHLRTLNNFVSEKSGKRCQKSGKHWIKIGKPGNFEDFFPVSAPEICKKKV